MKKQKRGKARPFRRKRRTKEYVETLRKALKQAAYGYRKTLDLSDWSRDEVVHCDGVELRMLARLCCINCQEHPRANRVRFALEVLHNETNKFRTSYSHDTPYVQRVSVSKNLITAFKKGDDRLVRYLRAMLRAAYRGIVRELHVYRVLCGFVNQSLPGSRIRLQHIAFTTPEEDHQGGDLLLSLYDPVAKTSNRFYVDVKGKNKEWVLNVSHDKRGIRSGFVFDVRASVFTDGKLDKRKVAIFLSDLSVGNLASLRLEKK